MSGDQRWPADVGPSRRWTIYTRGNIGEVYPAVVLPLEADLSWISADRGWRSGAAEIGFAVPADFGDEPYVMLGVFGGYAYFNLSIMRLLGVRTPGMGPELIDSQFLGKSNVAPYEARKGDRRLSASLRVVRTALSTLRAKDVPLLAAMRQRAELERSLFPGVDASDDELLKFVVDGFTDPVEYFVSCHVVNTMRATIAAGALTDFCEKHLGDPNRALELTTGIGDVVSAQPARALWRIANETADGDRDEAMASFLEEFGHRGPNEFSLNGRDWASHPELAIAAMEAMRGLDPSRSPEAQGKLIVERRKQALSEARSALGRKAKRLDKMLDNVALWSRAREESKDLLVYAGQLARHAFIELCRRAHEGGGVSDRTSVMLLTRSEFEAYLADPPSLVATIEERRVEYDRLSSLEPPFAFDSRDHAGGFPPTDTWERNPAARAAQGEVEVAGPGTRLVGAGGAPGMASGRARVIHDPADAAVLDEGDVLIAPVTDPSWTPLFVGASAVVVEIGAAMSHSMIVSRELGIPCVVGIENATLRIPDGALVEVDGTTGIVRVL